MSRALVLLVVLLAGCQKSPGAIAVAGNGSSAVVTEIRLSDGTRCAALVGSYKGAIDCDWREVSVE